MLLQSFVDYFYLSERQSIEPVHFRQMSIAMLLTQLSATQTHNSTTVHQLFDSLKKTQYQQQYNQKFPQTQWHKNEFIPHWQKPETSSLALHILSPAKSHDWLVWHSAFLERKRCCYACLILSMRPHTLSWFSQDLPAACKRCWHAVSVHTVTKKALFWHNETSLWYKICS